MSDALDTGGPQGPPPTSSPEKSGSGGGGAGVDLDRLARLGTPPGGLDDACYSIGAVEPWELRALVARVRVLETALRQIQQWDCLNPPRPDLLSDLPWLRQVVDSALGEAQ